jgi:flagellar basal-body rod modification protein FlgD
MKLLITQLEHQDPTAPKDDSQLIAQLAQFSSLERLTSMDESLKQLTGLFSGVLGSPATPVAGSQTSSQEGKA